MLGPLLLALPPVLHGFSWLQSPCFQGSTTLPKLNTLATTQLVGEARKELASSTPSGFHFKIGGICYPKLFLSTEQKGAWWLKLLAVLLKDQSSKHLHLADHSHL